jgi:hypothetical protein
MARKEPRDRQRQPEAGLFLVSDRTPPQEWQSPFTPSNVGRWLSGSGNVLVFDT